jgi:hypothetical protein
LERERVVWKLVPHEVVSEFGDLFAGKGKDMEQGHEIYYGDRVVLTQPNSGVDLF